MDGFLEPHAMFEDAISRLGLGSERLFCRLETQKHRPGRNLETLF
jgi:hypothetical protein